MTLGPSPYPQARRRQQPNPLGGMVAGQPQGASPYVSHGSAIMGANAAPGMGQPSPRPAPVAPAMMGASSPAPAAPSPMAEAFKPLATSFGQGGKSAPGDLFGALDQGRQDQHRLRLAGALAGNSPSAEVTPQTRALADALANYREADAPGLLRGPLGLPTASLEEQAATVRSAMTTPTLFGFQDPASALFAQPAPVSAAARDPDWVEGLFSGW